MKTTDMYINERVKAVRLHTGRTQKDFAADLGISRSHISNIENCNEAPSLMLIKFLALKYNVSEEWLVSGRGEMWASDKPVPRAINLPKCIRDKIKRQNQAVFTAQTLACEIERWCEQNGIDTTSEDYIAAKAPIEDAVGAIYAEPIRELYRKRKE